MKCVTYDLTFVARAVLVIFPVSMWRAFTASYLASVVYTCFLVLVLLANILLSFVLGPRLYRFMRSYGLRGNLAMNDFLKRVCYSSSNSASLVFAIFATLIFYLSATLPSVSSPVIFAETPIFCL